MAVSTISSAGLTASGVTSASLDSNAQYYGFKNRIINGAMQVWQRGTSLPSINGYCADRWFTGSGVAAPNVARVAGPTGYQYAMQITGVATNTICAIGQRIESVNCADLVGQNITISANIAVSSAQTIVWFLYHPTASDNFNTQTQIATGTWSATTTATTFTATVSNLPSGVANGLQVQFYMNNGGAFTSGTFTITGVQLEKGSTATSFDYRPYGTELALCQRYYQGNLSSGSTGTSTGNAIFRGNNSGATGSFYYWMPFSVLMRSAPTMGVGNPTYSNASSAVFFNAAQGGAELSFTVTLAGGYAFIPWSASSEL